jgi:hypothetical protein
VLVKILKRKDASSVIVAIVLADIIYPVLLTISRLAGNISGLNNQQYPSTLYSPNGSPGWQGEYLYPVVLAILEIILLEILVRVYVWATGSMKKR